MECTLCTTQIQDDQPKTTLLCAHTFHTRCVMDHFVRHGARTAQCATCNESIVPHDMFQYETHEDEDVNTELEIVDTIYKTQPSFVDEIKILKKSSASVNKSYSRLLKSASASAKTFHADLKDVISFLKDKHKQKLNEVLKSEHYVEFKKTAAKYSGKLRQFTNKWGVNYYMLSRYLRRNNQGTTFLFSGWRLQRLKHNLIRKFRIRI